MVLGLVVGMTGISGFRTDDSPCFGRHDSMGAGTPSENVRAVASYALGCSAKAPIKAALSNLLCKTVKRTVSTCKPKPAALAFNTLVASNVPDAPVLSTITSLPEKLRT